ncbi:ABC transporter substrate-binding protein [Xylophilus rhododendri]|uniref:ABC transporter substrate-binding protein n=1 Tax=Xylophilus rhododendri TaxID=2697032 RepID=A0A857J1V9_9BURK|nr:ABC transporter substrate-binding protein [Xylophilus rhododendri]QHI96938.1 ABC transporter substrate-binding protein [Xylophilus rhododendri]
MASLPSFRPSRRLFTAGAALAGVGLGVPLLLRAQDRIERPALRICVGEKASFYHLPLSIAERLGYFAAAGLQVQIDDYGSGAAALQALLSGRADVCAGAFKHTLSLQSRHQYCTAFVLEGRAPQVVTGVSLRSLPDYKQLEDLRNRRIGVSALGATTHLAATLVVARANLRPSDVSFVPVGLGASAAQAVRSGQVDAIVTLDPLITQLEQKGEVCVVSDTRTLKDTKSLFGGPMPAGCLYAPEAFLRQAPHTTQALADAMVRALKWLQTASPGDILKTVPPPYLQNDRALYLAAFQKLREAISPDGLIPEEGAATVLRAAAGFEPELAQAHLETGRLFTNEFARRAKQRYEA